ncbi:hypothetical protein [Bradyrhizobium yuanmingense]|uniref:hypothetical protein n=1 Tax=Bradyrhizobium yuanmingense TaxID=108015 RepID=UPI0023B9E8B3|nr:hypothetical protein [Bradyrhizobium yuanmingense]MDF0584142.1 hypothetical protein [Bradyrhizobium yuanmingense]
MVESMRRCQVGLVAAFFGLVFPANACDIYSATETIDVILREIRDGTIDRVDVLSIPENVNTFRTISPQMMEGFSAGKYSMKIARENMTQLSASLAALEPRQGKESTDLRWGFWFLDKSGRRLHSIFFDAEHWYTKGRRGYIDGNSCNFSSSLTNWARRNRMYTQRD